MTTTQNQFNKFITNCKLQKKLIEESDNLELKMTICQRLLDNVTIISDVVDVSEDLLEEVFSIVSNYINERLLETKLQLLEVEKLLLSYELSELREK